MLTVNIADAKAKLSELLDRALAGEEIVIARAGNPLARLVPIASRAERKPGAWRGWQASPEGSAGADGPRGPRRGGGKICR
jgi:prevent-host-death family protein